MTERKGRTMGQFLVSAGIIERGLGLPEGCRIVGCEWDFGGDNLRLYVEDPSLPEVEAGSRVPNLGPTITTTVDHGKFLHTFNWNKSRRKRGATDDGFCRDEECEFRVGRK